MSHLLMSVLLSFTLTVTLAGSPYVIAAETPENAQAGAGPDDDTAAGNEAEAANDESAFDPEEDDSAVATIPRDSDETFVPSVQISEDLSVSFPVDI